MALNDYEIVLKAAADPARVRILKLLGGRELCVYQLMELLALSQSTISGHLSLLKKAGLVNDRRDGRWVHYSLCDKKRNQYALPMLALILGWLDDDPRVRADQRRLASRTKKNDSRRD